MKRKKIMAGILALGVLAGSGYGIYELAGENIIGNALEPNVVYAEKSEEGINQDLKDEAMKIIKSHFGKTPDFKQMEFSTKTLTKEDQISEIDNAINFRKNFPEDIETAIKEFEKNLNYDEETKRIIEEKRVDRLEKVKRNIKYGITYINWQSEDERYTIAFDDQTKELLTAQYELKIDESEINPNDFVSIEEAQNTAETFLIKNYLDGIENLELVKKEEFQAHLGDEVGGGFDFNAVAFFYQEAEDASKKANIVVDRITGEVTEFAVGKAAKGITYKTSPY